mmetsp:Transcript_6384/g.25780  ORF Transcript_6384/g.25780 Transcript_6384/m.25780 type:complete len:273 (-) Transcript_6384:1805-2623(-)
MSSMAWPPPQAEPAGFGALPVAPARRAPEATGTDAAAAAGAGAAAGGAADGCVLPIGAGAADRAAPGVRIFVAGIGAGGTRIGCCSGPALVTPSLSFAAAPLLRAGAPLLGPVTMPMRSSLAASSSLALSRRVKATPFSSPLPPPSPPRLNASPNTAFSSRSRACAKSARAAVRAARSGGSAAATCSRRASQPGLSFAQLSSALRSPTPPSPATRSSVALHISLKRRLISSVLTGSSMKKTMTFGIECSSTAAVWSMYARPVSATWSMTSPP